MEYMNALSKEQQDQLNEVFEMCYFSNKSDEKVFWKKVWEAGEVEISEPISQDSFEMCYLEAKELLFQRGCDMFTRKKVRVNNPWFKITQSGTHKKQN